MTLRSDLIKSQDVATVYSSLLRSSMGREVVLSFMIIHWTTICKKLVVVVSVAMNVLMVLLMVTVSGIGGGDMFWFYGL